MAVGLPENPSFPGHSPYTKYFLPCCFLNDRRRAPRSLSKIDRLFSLFSCLSHARLLILILLLMSGNVHPNPGPIFPHSVNAANVTWRGRLVQCCTCSKWVHLGCSLFSFLDSNLLTTLTPGAFFYASFLLLLEVPNLPILCLPIRTSPACKTLSFNLIH